MRDVAQEAFDRGVLLPVLKDVDRPPLGFRQLRCADSGLVFGASRTGRGYRAAARPGWRRDPAAALPPETSQPSDAEDLDFERSTIIMKSDLPEASVGAPATQPLSASRQARQAASTSEKLVSVRLRGGSPGDLEAGR